MSARRAVLKNDINVGNTDVLKNISLQQYVHMQVVLDILEAFDPVKWPALLPTSKLFVATLAIRNLMYRLPFG